MKEDKAFSRDEKWIVGYYRGKRQCYIAETKSVADAVRIIDLLNELHAAATQNTDPYHIDYPDFSFHAGTAVDIR